TFVVGIWLVVIGVFEVVSSFGIRKAGKDLAGLREKPAEPPTEQSVS
ncbi:MAG TPA: HdeD family acid-resistance protein, partial [Mycobacterium sp.]|nr:HdeD family acid-resistance protein [Mycobacterium sp.]